jgi:hypothetical protein
MNYNITYYLHGYSDLRDLRFSQRCLKILVFSDMAFRSSSLCIEGSSSTKAFFSELLDSENESITNMRNYLHRHRNGVKLQRTWIFILIFESGLRDWDWQFSKTNCWGEYPPKNSTSVLSYIGTIFWKKHYNFVLMWHVLFSATHVRILLIMSVKSVFMTLNLDRIA